MPFLFRFDVLKVVSIIIGISTFSSPALAQVASDNTLSTRVRTSDNLNFTILGGELTGNNLFHSFSEFSVPTYGSATFNHATDINTIFSRVTGNAVSTINGQLRTTGSADLFLLNPNGIIFGPSATLSLSGSFFATTADQILFDNNQVFSATGSLDAPLLSISTPIGLQFGSMPQSITVQGSGHNLFILDNRAPFPSVRTTRAFSRGSRFALGSDDTLAFVGGDILFDGGKAAAGRIELGSVAQSGEVSLISTPDGLTIDYGNIEEFGTLSVTQNALVEASGEMENNLHLQAGEISITEGALITNNIGNGSVRNAGNAVIRAADSITLAGSDAGVLPGGILINGQEGSLGNLGDLSIETNSLVISHGARLESIAAGAGDGGTVTITANSIEVSGLTGSGSSSGVFVDTVSAAEGSSLMLNTDSLQVSNGGQITAGTLDAGNAGSLVINASTVDLTGRSQDFPNVNTGLFSDTLASGNGGPLFINTEHLTVTDGASIRVGTEGTGNGSSLWVQASDSIVVGGQSEANRFSSTLSSETFNSFANFSAGGGHGGNISLETPHLQVGERGIISASTFGAGNAGDILIDAAVVEVSDGILTDEFNRPSGITSFVAPETLKGSVSATGHGGDITINANQLSLLAGGQIDTSTFAEGSAGNIYLTVDELMLSGTSSILADGTQLPSRVISASETEAAAGTITILGTHITIQNSAEINVSGLGQGGAGNVALTAETIRLDQGGRLLAEVNGGTEGNIVVNAQELLLLRHGSSITTNATDVSTGGNITLEAPLIVGVPHENSDIIANAVQGNGGNINIRTQALLGLEFRDRTTSQSDITASSESGLEGTVTIVRPPVNIVYEPLVLSGHLQDTSHAITTQCNPGDNNTFVITRQGGVPPTTALLESQSSWIDWRQPTTEFFKSSSRSELFLPNTVQEATEIEISPDGTVQLLMEIPYQSHVSACASGTAER
ncbi:MAG: filamentous hemagglutinin N-terminal domain-containing protein [Cyanobacteria bacterium P01_D01_bin.156]